MLMPNVKISNATMPNRKSRRSKKKKMLKECPSTDSNQGSDQSEERRSKPSPHEFEAREASLSQNREASVDRTETASEDGVQGSRCFDSSQVQVEEVVRSPLQNHYQMISGRRYCMIIIVYEPPRQDAELYLRCHGVQLMLLT